MNDDKVSLFVMACVATITLSLSGCVSAQSQSPLVPPMLEPAGPPSCGSPDEDYLAFLTNCDVTAASLEALGEEMGLQFYAPNIEVSKNDPELFGAAAFGDKCLVQVRFASDGEIIDGVFESKYRAAVQKRVIDGYLKFVTDEPAFPADLAVALQAFEPECS